MFRPGTDERDVRHEDVLCDFCARPWDPDDPARPFIEGHHGSHLCGECLALAYLAIVHEGRNDRAPGQTCTMCLEERDDESFRSPERPAATICRRCVKQSATALEKDPDSRWRRPAAPA